MTAVEILLKIRALFERGGADEAKEAVDAVGKAGEEAAGGLTEAADAAKSAGEAAGGAGADGFNAMGMASAAMQGNMQGVANGAVNLMGKIDGLKMSMMSLSLVTASITAASKLISALDENLQKWADRLNKIQTDNARGEVDRLMNSYSRLVEEMGKADASRDRWNAAVEDTLQAMKEEELAVNNLGRAKAIAAAQDEEGRRRVELEFDERQARIEGRYATKSATARLTALEEDSSSKRREIEMLREQQEAFLSRAAGHNQQAQYENQQGVAETTGFRGAWAYVSGRAQRNLERRQGAAAEYGQLAKDELAKAGEVGKKIEGLEAGLEEDARQIELLRQEIQTARINRNAEEVTRETARADFEKEVEVRKAAEAAAAAKAEEDARRKAAAAAIDARIDANGEREEARRGDYRRAQEKYAPLLKAARQREAVEKRSAAEAAKVYDSVRRGGAGTAGGYDKVVAAANERAQAASREVRELERELNATLQAIVSDINRLREDTRAARQERRLIPNG